MGNLGAPAGEKRKKKKVKHTLFIKVIKEHLFKDGRR